MDSTMRLMAALCGLLCSCLIWAESTPFVPRPGVPSEAAQPQASLAPLLDWFSGDFANAEQARDDDRFASASLRLMEIWPGRPGVRWIYAEQSLAERAPRPFRQRIYRFSEASGGRILMSELTMPRATDFAGAWRQPELLDSLTPQQLSLRQGCEIWLHRQPSGEYQGHSDIGRCTTDFGGASTLVQYLWIGPDRVRLLDRAYDEGGKLRWGSPGEGYLYLRKMTERGE
ncbi:chromophore lyase CpcT/CpeT [Aeromonas molluscorum]|nr:chromophore lyase CpcT/CpeT [Aeromonas molluscorum]